jgi:hemerythrin
MKLVEWSDDLSVGMEEIDAQHKILVSLLNRFHKAVITGQDHRILQEVLEELMKYTAVHFSLEEQLMRTCNYPDYANHKKRHEELLAQIQDFHARVGRNEEGVSKELWTFLRRWLTQHIQGSDKQYAPYLIKHTAQRSEIKLSWLARLRGAVYAS